MAASVALACIAALGVLLFGLGIHVSMTRNKLKRPTGAGNDPSDPLYRVSHAHSNTAEYAPMLSVLYYVLSQKTAPLPYWVEWTMVIATMSRFMIVIGLLQTRTATEVHPLRFVGAWGTYLAGIALCAATVMY